MGLFYTHGVPAEFSGSTLNAAKPGAGFSPQRNYRKPLQKSTMTP